MAICVIKIRPAKPQVDHGVEILSVEVDYCSSNNLSLPF